MSRASPDPQLSKGFFQDLSKLRENHDFEDFKVILNEEIFTCHSFILAAYSEFFRCLLRYDMKEKREMAVELNNISSPIFQLILNYLYTGCIFLTKENVLEVWEVVHQLQIQLLIEHCEDFVIDNVSLDTVVSYQIYADLFQSQKVCECIFAFMLNNFETLREKKIFFKMDFNSLKRLSESDKLNISSEDIILDSIFKWVNYPHIFVKKERNEYTDSYINTIQDIDYDEIMEGTNQDNSILEANDNAVREEKNIDSKNLDEQNERKKYLVQLLKSARYYLASKACILKLSKHNLARNNIFVKEILFNSLIFTLGDHCHGHWPTAAIHRDCSDFEHVGVFCDEQEISVFSLKQDKWFFVPNLKTLKYSHLTVFKGKLYACSIGRADNEIYVLNANCWKRVTILKHAIQLFLSHEQYMYMLDSIEKVFIKFNPDTSPIQLETISHELQNPEFALSFYDTILVFCSVDTDGHDETAVHSWNIENNKWTQLDTLEFSSKNMASFRDDLSTYILDSIGNLWKLTNSEVISFTFVAKLWIVKYKVRGAFLFRKTLFIFNKSSVNLKILKKVKGVFSKTISWCFEWKTSNVLHYVIPKREIEPFQRTESEYTI